MSSPEAVAWLFSLQRFGMEPGLGRTRALLDAVGSPQSGMRVVLVAGTNGKGSTTAILAACLQAAGHKTGSFFSPHLQRVGERAIVDGVEATSDEMEAAVQAVRPHAERLGATFFEVVTVASLVRFALADVGWAVMEVGLGGRLDSTNALDPALSLITPVALDHTAVLGSDVKAIAAEKAGILRAGVPAITAATGEALDAISTVALELGAPLSVIGRDYLVRLTSNGWDGIEILLEAANAGPTRKPADTSVAGLLPLALRSPLLGGHQAGNVALAATAALQLGVEAQAVSAAVAATGFPGRLEVVSYRSRRFVLDGAHNPHAASALARALAELGAKVAVLVLGTSADKDIDGVIAPLVGLATTVIATRAALSPRALEPSDLAARLQPVERVWTEPNPRAALRLALKRTRAGDTVVVAGSLFLVGEFRTLLAGGEDEPGQRWQ